jgi:nickel-dependent lactate racemase
MSENDLVIGRGSASEVIGAAAREEILREAVAAFVPSPRRILLLPPDFTRFNSAAGDLTARLYRQWAPHARVDILPALGTHVPMTEHELRTMFGPEIPLDRFLVHDWRRELVHRGDVPGELLREWSEGRVDYPVRIEVNRRLLDGYDLILSIGQVVPHEVVGMANYTKNVCVGVGGQDTINKSHFLGAVYGMERIMGRAETPVRRLFNYGCTQFLADLPIHYLLTVMQRDHAARAMVMRGLFCGGEAAFQQAADLSRQVNLDLLDAPLRKVVVHLDPEEFKSTWLGNKAIYRTRMALADDGELIILAPGLREFGEDPEIDRLIRKYGYRGTPATLAAVAEHEELRANLSAAAHLIHGSSEGRFRITYCPGPGMPPEALRAAGFAAAPYAEMARRYDPRTLRPGMNEVDGEPVFFIGNPGLGLWALGRHFGKEQA